MERLQSMWWRPPRPCRCRTILVPVSAPVCAGLIPYAYLRVHPILRFPLRRLYSPWLFPPLIGMGGNLPGGLVTLLFTDVVGSSRLVHELGAGFGPMLAEYRRRLRQT